MVAVNNIFIRIFERVPSQCHRLAKNAPTHRHPQTKMVLYIYTRYWDGFFKAPQHRGSATRSPPPNGILAGFPFGIAHTVLLRTLETSEKKMRTQPNKLSGTKKKKKKKSHNSKQRRPRDRSRTGCQAPRPRDPAAPRYVSTGRSAGRRLPQGRRHHGAPWGSETASGLSCGVEAADP